MKVEMRPTRVGEALRAAGDDPRLLSRSDISGSITINSQRYNPERKSAG